MSREQRTDFAVPSVVLTAILLTSVLGAIVLSVFMLLVQVANHPD